VTKDEIGLPTEFFEKLLWICAFCNPLRSQSRGGTATTAMARYTAGAAGRTRDNDNEPKRQKKTRHPSGRHHPDSDRKKSGEGKAD
jgi:hypothetical protein